jgi:hypothetical protein
MLASLKRIDAWFKDHLLVTFLSLALCNMGIAAELVFRHAGAPSVGKIIAVPFVMFTVTLFAGKFMTLRPGITPLGLLPLGMTLMAGIWIVWLMADERFLTALEIGSGTTGFLMAMIAWSLSADWHRWCDVRERASRMRLRRKSDDKLPSRPPAG